MNSNLPSIGITAQNMASGDYFKVTNVSGTGFTIHSKTTSNASISRNFNYSAVGFGKGVKIKVSNLVMSQVTDYTIANDTGANKK